MPVFLYLHYDRTSLATIDVLLPEIVQEHGGEICYRQEGGTCVVFFTGKPLECALLLLCSWNNDVPPQVGVHLAPVKQVRDRPHDPAVRHTEFLAEAAAPGQILLSEKAADILPLPRGAALQDLGHHMVKDLAPHQKIFQLMHVDLKRRDFPPPRTLSSFKQNFLPRTPPFIGRRRELAGIAQHLRGGTRLLTLTGVGGVGKSRLAYQAAAVNIEAFTHGIFFVPTIPVPSPQLLPSTVAEALSFSFHGRMDTQKQLLNYLRRKNLLLILDSYEHLLPYVELPRAILSKAPGVTLLVTSQQVLGLEQEETYTLSGLSYPTREGDDEIGRYEAVELFVQIAHHIDPLFTLDPENATAVAEICRTVEGLPLGVNMAATLVRILSCQEILTGIRQTLDFLKNSRRQLPERHRSLRAVFEYSWSLISAEEREIVSRLVVFRGGFQAEAAATVMGITPVILKRLQAKSLLRCLPSGRFYVPTPLRQYTLERLQAQSALYDHHCQGHATYYARLLQHSTPSLWEAGQKETLHRLIEELHNLQAMWYYAVEAQNLELLRLTARGMYRLHEMRSRFHEGRALFEEATAMVRTLRPSSPDAHKKTEELLALLTLYQGALCYLQSAHETANELLRESRSLLQRYAMPGEMGYAHLYLGATAFRQGYLERARKSYEEARTIFEERGEAEGMASVYLELGKVNCVQGDYETANYYYAQSVAIRRSVGDLWGTAQLYHNLGGVAFARARYKDAQNFFKQSLKVEREFDNRWGISFALNGLGLTAFEVGDYEEARMHLERSLNLRRELGADWAIASSLDHVAHVLVAQGNLDEAESLAREALILRRQVNDQIGHALSIYLLATVALARGECSEAETGYREALRMFQSLKDHSGVRRARNGLGETLLMQGKISEACELFTATQARCAKASDPQYLIYALAGLGEVFAQRGQTQQAWSYYRAALQRVREIPTPPLFLKVCYGIAKLYLQSGNREEALSLLQLIYTHPATAAPLQEQAGTLLARMEVDLARVTHPSEQFEADHPEGLVEALLESLPGKP
ncbi:MAG: tetratricopeptide repeat protein [Anaerolineales bacterium]